MNKTQVLIFAAGIALAAICGAAVANAAPTGFSYDHSDGAFGPPGSTLLLGSVAVPAENVGQTCQVTVDLSNNDSTRPGSDITVASGTSSRVFLNTEGVKGDPGPVTFPLELGTSITAELTFGPNLNRNGDAEFSGSGSVTLGDCSELVCLIPEGCDEPPVTVGPPIGPAVRPPTAAVAVAATPGFTG